MSLSSSSAVASPMTVPWFGRLEVTRETVAVVGLVALAAVVRVPYLWDIPRFTDETQEALRALRIARGEQFPLTNVDPYIGAFWNYLVALAFALGGPSLLTPRLLVLALGALTVIPAYLLGNELGDEITEATRRRTGSNYPRIGPAVGGLTALLLALSPTHIVVNSHIAWSNCLTPLFATTGLWLLLRSVRHDRPRSLLPAALFLGLAVQTHPTALLILPGAAAYLILSRPSWLRTPWPYVATLFTLAAVANVLLEASQQTQAWTQGIARIHGTYVRGETLSPEVYWRRLTLLLNLVANSLGGVLSETDPLVSPLERPAILAGCLAALAGLELATRRRAFLPLFAFASLALLLPLVNPKYEYLVPKARYIAPLLPICYATIALFVVDAYVTVRTMGGGRHWVVQGLQVGVSLCLIALLVGPLAGLQNYYRSATEAHLTTESMFRTIDAIESNRRPGEPVVLESSLAFPYTLGGGRLSEQLVLAGHLRGWPVQTTAIPKPNAAPAPRLRGIVVVRPEEESRLTYQYRSERVGVQPEGYRLRLYRVAGRKPTPAAPSPTSLASEPPRSELVVSGVSLPAALTFAPDGRLLFNEVSEGRVRIVEDGELQDDPFVVLPTTRGLEQGALGLVLDPDFESTHWVYVFYSEADTENRPLRNRVVRFTEEEGRATNATAILGDLPINATRFYQGGNNGGRMAFGPDGKLYISLGEMARRSTVSNPRELNGKILRVNRDGSIPDDNPQPGLLPFAVGFRNVWGMAFNPTSERLYATDNGPRGFDELNLVAAGKNYAYPTIEGGPGGAPRFVDPIWHSGNEGLGITGMAFYTGWIFPEYTGDLFFCAFTTGALRRVHLGGAELNRVELVETISNDCRLDVVDAPDGTIYFSDLASIYRLVR